MAMLTAGLLALPHITAAWQVYGWAACMGIGGGFVTVLFFTVWPRVFGRRQLGRIQGAAQAMTVVASAVGPLLLAWCVERTGAYARRSMPWPRRSRWSDSGRRSSRCPMRASIWLVHTGAASAP